MSRAIDRQIATLTADITAAATAYEARWTLAALNRVSPEISAKLARQIDLWTTASRDGDPDEIELQGRALVRGYRKAAEIMSTSGADDDAYVIGKDAASGLVIAIGHQMASVDRVVRVHGPVVVFITPDEIAGLLNSLNGFAAIAEIKRRWPGAVSMPQETD